MVSSKECNVHDGVAEGCAALALRWRRRDPSLAYHMLYDITGLISINMTETTRKWLDRTNRGIMSPSERTNWVPYPELRRAADVHRERAPSSDARLCLDIGGARMPPRRDLDFTWMLVMMGIPFGKIWYFAKQLRKRGLGNWLLLEDAPAAAAATAGAAAAAAAAGAVPGTRQLQLWTLAHARCGVCSAASLCRRCEMWAEWWAGEGGGGPGRGVWAHAHGMRPGA